MRSYSASALLLLTANFSHAASPVLPLEMISRNALGEQTRGRVFPNSISSQGTKVAFSLDDRFFFNEPPPPPPEATGGAFAPKYGQVALWKRGIGHAPLIQFSDGYGPTSSLFDEFLSNTGHVKLSDFSNRICFPVRDGDVVLGIRLFGQSPGDGGGNTFCTNDAGPPYQYLLGLNALPAVGAVFGGDNFDYLFTYIGEQPNGSSFSAQLKDRQSGQILDNQILVGSDGHFAASLSGVSDVSANGRWILFQSDDNTLVPGDTGTSFGGIPFGGADFFIRDRALRTTRRLLRPSGGELLGYLNREYAFSSNGRFLVFSSTGDVVEPCLTNFNGPPSPGLSPEPIFVHDFQTNSTECISLTQSGQAFGNGFQSGVDNRVSISGDGRFVAYSTAYPADLADTNGKTDVYLRDRKLNRTIWVSQAATGAPGNSRSVSPLISEDGRWLAFVSYASNMVPNDTNLPAFGNPNFQGGDIFLRDLSALSVEPVQVPAGSNWAWALLVLGLLGFGMRARHH